MGRRTGTSQEPSRFASELPRRSGGRGAVGSEGVQPTQPKPSAGAANLSFFGGCVQYPYLSPSLSLFSCLARSFGDRRGSTHPRISDRFPLPELVILQGVCAERLSISLFLALD